MSEKYRDGLTWGLKKKILDFLSELRTMAEIEGHKPKRKIKFFGLQDKEIVDLVLKELGKQREKRQHRYWREKVWAEGKVLQWKKEKQEGAKKWADLANRAIADILLAQKDRVRFFIINNNIYEI